MILGNRSSAAKASEQGLRGILGTGVGGGRVRSDGRVIKEGEEKE